MMTTIGIVTDVHMNSERGESVRTALRGIVDRFVEDVQPDYVVVMGDMIHDADTKEQDRQNLQQVIDAFDDVECPVRYLLGNHDVGNLTRVELQDFLDQELWGSVTIGDRSLVFLDTSAPWLSGARGEVDDAQLDFLETELSEQNEQVVFAHHPIHYHDIRENYWFGEYPERGFCGNKKEVTTRLEDHANVRATVNGHLHETCHVRYRDVDHVTVSSVRRERPDAGVTGTHAVARIGDTFEVDVYDSDARTHSFST